MWTKWMYCYLQGVESITGKGRHDLTLLFNNTNSDDGKRFQDICLYVWPLLSEKLSMLELGSINVCTTNNLSHIFKKMVLTATGYVGLGQIVTECW